MTNEWQNDGKTETCQTLVKTLDNGSTLTNERTNGLTNDFQDQGSNRLVPDAPTPVDNHVSLKWRIKKEQIWLERWTYSRMGWSVYYGRRRVARYTTWARCCEHIAVAHRRFGL